MGSAVESSETSSLSPSPSSPIPVSTEVPASSSSDGIDVIKASMVSSSSEEASEEADVPRFGTSVPSSPSLPVARALV